MSDTERKPPTAKEITIRLYWTLRGASQLLIPRYTPSKWWECDMWRLTKADFVDEYEIKMSVADFKADLLKCQRGWEIGPDGRYQQKAPVTKHELLAGSERGPNRFWFVVPEAIEEKIEVPPYAGLMVFGRCNPVISKQAPRRHGRKWDGNKLAVFSAFYHRYWTHEARTKEEIPPAVELTELDATFAAMQEGGTA